VSETEQAILDLAYVWADAVDAYETACRREHEPWRAYPEASGKRRLEEAGWVPCSEQLVAAARRARDAEDALRAAIKRHVDGR
jgi:hypothetical protein